MADILTLNPEEKDIRKIVAAIRQLAERFQPSEDLAAGALLAANNLSDVASAPTSVANLGFPTTVTEVGDTNYTILSTDWVIVTNAALTTARTWTLPAASDIKPWHPIHVFDRGNAGLGSNSLIVQRAGSDTIAGLTSITLNVSRTGARFVSDGSSKWTIERLVFGANQFLDQLSTTRGAILYRGASTWDPLAPGTSGHVLTSNGTGADPSYQVIPNSNVVLQLLQTTYATNTSLSTTIPWDDTTPTSSEGTEVLSQAITPTDNTNKILCSVSLWGAVDTSSSRLIAALFRGTTCIQVVAQRFNTLNFAGSLKMEFLDSPATTSSTTYSVRVGADSGIVRLNGDTTARFFGGTSTCTLTVSEISA